MHSLKPYSDKSKGVADLLDWAALIDDGIVQGKSGALHAGWDPGLRRRTLAIIFAGLSA